MFCVDVISTGKYNDCELGGRFFFTKKSALEFIEVLKGIEAEYKIGLVRNCGGAFCGSLPYYEEIDMVDYEAYGEISLIERVFLKTLGLYDREKMYNYFYIE